MNVVVSISLGSSSRDFDRVIDINNTKLRVIRQGVDGDKKLAAKLIKEYDGKIAFLGLGGINLSYQWANKKYFCPEGVKLAKLVKKAIIVDGSIVKRSFDWQAINLLKSITDLKDKKVLIVSALDRPHLVEFVCKEAYSYQIGDAIFGLKIPIPFNSSSAFDLAVRMTMPMLKNIPLKLLYPTGKKQDILKPSYLAKFINAADIICGDFHLFRRIMPSSLKNKIILTSTVTSLDISLIKQLGGKVLITSSPLIDGRALGANVWEAILCTLENKIINKGDVMDILTKYNIKPELLKLN